MARLDVHARRDGAPACLLDVQADLLSRLATRLVVPLLPEDQAPRPAARLNPVFAAAVRVRELGTVVASLSDQHVTVTAALDLLTTGV